MRRSLLAAALTLALAGVAMPQDAPYATVDDARLKDTYAGALPAGDAEVHFVSFLAAKSKFTVTVLGETDGTLPAAAGVRLALFGPDGEEIVVTGTNKDKSKPDKNRVKWSNVKLEQTGFHTFVVSADTGGGWSFELSGKPKSAESFAESTAELGLGEETFVEFDGLAGGRVTGKVKAPGKGNKLEGQFTRVEEPDGGVLGAEDLDEKGRLFLRQDGTHKAFFRNVGKAPGAWKTEITSKARDLARRKGIVDADGVTWRPKVEKVKPGKAYHLLDEVELVITGRDFQPDPDIRLVRNNREDILGTDIEFVSESELRCFVDLDTRETPDGKSTGNWNVGVWNDPDYTVENDRSTLVKDTFTSDQKKKFKSLNDGDIELPLGTGDDTEVFVVQFSGGFATDIRRMGFGSTDSVTEDRARARLEDYVILYLRHLFLINETVGNTGKSAVPLSFVRSLPPGVAGDEGVDYNVIQVGGEQQPADPRDPNEFLDWGFVPLDVGNADRSVLRQETDEGERVGLGVRLRFLDPDDPRASESWIDAMEPLLASPLNFDDRRYWQDGYFPFTVEEAERMNAITLQTERAAREIAAVIAHHLAKELGVDGGGAGPTANPTEAGAMWTERLSLEFSQSDIETLQGLAVPHEMPGKADRYRIKWFTLATTVAYRLEDALTDESYEVLWDLFGGRPNTKNNDYKAGYASGSGKPLGMTLKVSGLSGRPPLYRAVGTPYCDLENLRINFTDTKHDVRQTIRWQLRVFSDVDKLRLEDQAAARECNRLLEKL